MKKIILLIAIAALFTSCGIFKKTSRNTLNDKSETNQLVNEDIKKKDQSIITTRDKIDTTFLIPEKTISKEAIATQDQEGNYIARFDTSGLKAIIKYNQETGKFNFDLYQHSELMPIKIDRTITESRDITEAITRVEKNKGKKDIKSKDKIAEPSDPVISIFRFLALLFTVVLVFLILRKIMRSI